MKKTFNHDKLLSYGMWRILQSLGAFGRAWEYGELSRPRHYTCADQVRTHEGGDDVALCSTERELD